MTLISEIQARQGNIDLDECKITQKDKPREFEKFGKKGKVCNCTIENESGEIKLTLWNEDVDKFDVGDKIKITNGYCNEFQGEKQLTAGKFGKVEKIED
ncbi:DNA-binding protein [Candidatus Woesearchaeota archaeon]|nr:DNA-binding protein [Candidatus Woesearchaeota archaeon]